jgi:hypothetical protein
MEELVWERPWNTAYGIISIPKNTILYRGYNPRRGITTYPSYFGSKKTAEEYAKLDGRKLGAFRTTKPVKVLDIRFMKHLLTELFAENPLTETSHATILAFGLCSLYHQIGLAKIRFQGQSQMNEKLEAMRNALKNGLYEQPGIRIAETTNDGEVMQYLAELFEGFVDGFIAPRLETTFHTEKGGFLNPECILFNPKDAEIELLNTVDPPIFNKVTIATLCVIQYGKAVTIGKYDDMSDEFYLRGGGFNYNTLPSVEEFQDLLYKKDKAALQAYRRGKQNGKAQRLKTNYYSPEAPHPRVPVNSFSLEKW